MIKRMLMLFLIVFTLTMVLALWFSPEEAFYFLHRPESISVMKEDKEDGVKISMLASKNTGYYLDQDHLVFVHLLNPSTMEQVSLEVKELRVKGQVDLGQSRFYEVDFLLELMVGMEGYEIAYEEVLLVLMYENGEEVKISLGEFYYMKKPEVQDLSVLEMVATHADYHALTVSGLYVELVQDVYSSVKILDVELGTSLAVINPFYTKKIHRSISYEESLEDILMLTSYNPTKRQDGALDVTLRRGQGVKLYLPLTYLRDDLALHRFYIKIQYSYQGQSYESVIDDFPFIQQSYQAYRREDYHAYYPRVQRQEF